MDESEGVDQHLVDLLTTSRESPPPLPLSLSLIFPTPIVVGWMIL